MALQKHSCYQGQSKVPADKDALGTSWRDWWKAHLAPEELKKHCEAEPGRAAFVGQKFSLAGQQRPLLGEFIGLRIALSFSDSLRGEGAK
jgi:hypothetical protein